MKDPRWKKFEKLTARIQKELSPDADVQHNTRLQGHDSKTLRQIDIVIRQNIGQYPILVIMQCKDEKKPLDVNAVGEFADVVHDVRAQKGALVSSSGFSENAIQLARERGIDTFRLIDTSSIDWKVYASIPVLLERNFLKSYSLRFENFRELPIAMVQSDLKALRFFSSQENFLGTVADIIAQKWNKEEIEHVPGDKKIFVGDGFIEFSGEKIKLALTVNILVGREYFLGDLPVDLQGFKDEQSGKTITKGFTTASIRPFDIESGKLKNWKKIENLEKLSIKPIIRMTYNDVLPTNLT